MLPLPDVDLDLGGEPSGDPESDALFILCEEQGDAALPAVLEALKTDKLVVRESAVFMLQYFVDHHVMEPLLEALHRESSFKTNVEIWVYTLAFLTLAKQNEKPVLQEMLNLSVTSTRDSYDWNVSAEFLTQLLQN